VNTSTTVLDSALDRVSALDFELPNRFVNHGPMACEALATMGFEDRIDDWVAAFESMMGPAVRPASPRWKSSFDWRDYAGDYRMLPEWMGFFGRAIDDDGWPAVVGLWVPRLMPALASALFHGVIRTAHAVRAIEAADTPSRRAELARALGSWATWYHPGASPGPVVADDDPGRSAIAAAAAGARWYTKEPTIFNLHGVTGAMAVALLTGHIQTDVGAAAVAQLRAEHIALYGEKKTSMVETTRRSWDPALAEAAAESHDAHQIKLVEACYRGFAADGDPAFLRAARIVTGTG
jgi:Questin oxidase-like